MYTNVYCIRGRVSEVIRQGSSATMGKVATCHRQVAGISIRNALHCSPMVGMTVDLAVAVEESLK